ncbi:MAG: hypothetical protein M0R17_02155 [Candidatus Omnitrophica bacterium]|jgi:transketolase|nr:hypothetical protein [Candidatus Omnitrophota bacterium]
MVDLRDILFDSLYEYARQDDKIVFLTADADAFALKKFKRDFPDRFFNMGVAEQNAILVATGLAIGGFKPYIYSITSFMTMRCYEQIKVNICSMNLPITLIGLGAGFSFSFDGPTHHAINDIAIMRTLPEMTILNTSDAFTTKECVKLSYNLKAPAFIRLDKGIYPDYDFTLHLDGFNVIKNLSKVNVISTGTMVHSCVEALEGLKIGLVDMYKIKPYSKGILSDIINLSNKIVVVEENVKYGALSTTILEYMSEIGVFKPIIKIALEDKQFFGYADRKWLHEKYGLDINSLREKFINVLSEV